ncbi:Protein of unknown function DUF2470 [Aspergillus parasiticus SU-1]|uniref:DUF2470 domain-containing protein n=3 Tax=Aspergillus subgen. Circumdati TaxID=2720871 RepID=A0A5N6EXV6_9EURO|nr:hypothetical protein BDV33DRAFT_170114 [Aspergillus novoparasiticus]KAE8319040.1 hypothetical protein BDV41DRAFT_571357 [Aspergillus transmontanensis]KJK65290.1 Protein of unknown function DUF2470 [Aspergillus parasiticus SU-1]
MAAINDDKSASSKSFIINHMNADHQKSLAMYLRVYCNVADGDAKAARLEDITLSDLLISAKGTRYSVPLDPPMKTFSDTRQRVVAMHKECLERLGLSDIIIKEYRAPRGWEAINFAVVVATLIVFSRGSNFQPGSLLYETAGLDRFPAFTQFCHTVQPIPGTLLLGIHAIEVVLLAVKRLKPHGVPFLSGVWIAWVATIMIEGVFAFRRFDRMVKEEQVKREHRK